MKSPQILELSGIGNEVLLGAAGVNVHLNLPTVGENLQEHLYSGLTYGQCHSVEHLSNLIRSAELSPDADDLALHILQDPQIYKEHLEKLK